MADLNSRSTAPTATRHDLQPGRRAMHFSTGTIVATLYLLFLEHSETVYILGAVASVLYLADQIRIAYPELSRATGWLTRMFLRAEEELKESASVPYAMGLLLTIIGFPKIPAIIGIYTLAISDPLSAVVGILHGKTKIVKHKSFEGSIAFFFSCWVCALGTFWVSGVEVNIGFLMVASFMIALFAAIFELMPLRIDDNLTIPLFTSAFAWVTCVFIGIPTS